MSAVVTGAANGIGRALVEILAVRQVDLTLVDVERELLNEVAARSGGTAVLLDVASAHGFEALAASVGPVDLLCLNAGITGGAVGPVWEAPPEMWSRVLDVNLGGVVNGLRAFVPRMLATGREHRILITASLAGLATWESGGPYAASKHAVVTVAEQAALALAGTSVSVTVLCPALVRSGMSDVGADPAEVAAEALAAAHDGQFVVVPAEWAGAIIERAETLTTGRKPTPPSLS